MSVEMEWKLAAPDAAVLEEILRDAEVSALAAEPVRSLEMRSSYYDTPDRALGRDMCTLRRRMENETSVICVKAPLPDAPDPHMHGEWELEGEDVIAALPRLVELGAPASLLELCPPGRMGSVPDDPAADRVCPREKSPRQEDAPTRETGLACVCSAAFHRRAVLLRFADGSEAELALDLGVLSGPTASVPLCELELEMKRGAPACARSFLDRLRARYPLAPQPKSKYARARQLP